MMWVHEFELTLAFSNDDKTSTVHILAFSDPEEIDTWDVAMCSTSLGDWQSFDLRRDGPVQSNALCKRCFTNVDWDKR